MRPRFTLIILAIVAAYGFLMFRLYQVQLVKGNFYAARAASQAEAANGLNSRGTIYFTDDTGNLLPAAVDEPFPLIYAVPSEIADAQEAANELAPIVNIPASTLTPLFSRPNDQYELIIKKAPAEVATEVQNLKLKGIYVDSEEERSYPLGAIASQVLGFVGPNAANNGVSGKYGIEKEYDSTLSGADSSAGGSDIDLTIDPNIQIEAEKVLDDLVASNGATGGSVIVEDPQTGRILAMASTPTFDPNNYSEAPIASFLNQNVQAVYEPGSIIKVLTMAAGIDAGKISSSTTYDDKGYVNVNGAHITNYNLTTYGAYGPGTTMTEVIEHSINSGAIFAENQTGNPIFTEYMKRFGFDQPTGIDLPGEVTGNLSQLNPKSPQVDFDTAAYGQGIAMTSIELVQAVAALANGGTMMRPYLNAALSPQVLGQPISAATAKEVTEMMTAAIDDVPGAPAIKGYSLAGKTGSAFIPDLVHGGYQNKLTDSYIGYGPTSNPRFIALIRLNTLPVTSLAVDSVVPAWKELAQYIINYYQIPPDRISQ